MLLTISGHSGSGKTTVAEGLSQKLGFAHISAGEVFRKLAQERRLNLQQFSKLAERNADIDKMVDRRQVEIAQSYENVVVDGRLSGRMHEADIAVWLKAPLEVRAERIAQREGKDLAVALRETKARDQSEEARYKAFYDFDIANLDIYDLVIDTRHWDQFAVIDIVTQAVKTRREADRQ